MNALLKDYKEVKEDFKTKLRKTTEKFIITAGDEKGFVCADYKKKWQKKGAKQNFYIFILDKTKNQWVSSSGQKSLGAIFSKMLAKFRIDNTLFNEKIIGFLTSNKRKTKIVFKTKSMKPIGKKKERGQECPSKGEKYSSIINRINYLTGELHKNDKETKKNKYKMKPEGTVRERDKIDDSIYNIKKPQHHTNDDTTVIPLTDSQLCAETELLLRYLNETDDNGKRWFFSTIEDVINIIREKNI
jgi:hypothetical protein